MVVPSQSRIVPLSAIALGCGLVCLWTTGCDRTVAPKQDTTEKTQASAKSPASNDTIPASGLGVSADSASSESNNLSDNSTPSTALLLSPDAPSASDSSNTSSLDDLPTAQANETVTPSLPSPTSKLITVQEVKSDDPMLMVRHLGDLDRAIEDLLLASKRMDERTVKETAAGLARMKLAAGQHLASLSAANPEQVKLGTKAQLIALSHLSGLKDVQAAKQLAQFATGLLTSDDTELRHQGQVVLFGFKIQELQNGLLSDPDELVSLATDLLSDPKYRGRLEMTSLAHATEVLHHMGYAPQATAVEQSVFSAFADQADAGLRNEAWNQLTRNSQSLQNLMNSLQGLGTDHFDAGAVLSAARGLLMDFPNAVTLEMIAGLVTNIEYSGQVALSSDLSSWIDSEIQRFPSGYSATTIRAALAEHRQRMGWIGRQLVLNNLQDTSGVELDWKRYEGKVLLVDFWATWCPPCLKEIPHIRNAHETLPSKDFAVLSINMDQDAQQLNKFLEK
ncbi:MAG TPA: hypothetical protein DCF63_08895, partial [Planctomycetaceae bacterium]|nr:hypothetical protein [Planctomycetaceae bacterium]